MKIISILVLSMFLAVTTTKLEARVKKNKTKKQRAFLPASFKSDLEQIHISTINGRVKKSFGKIEYKFKGHIRYEITKPTPSLLVSNPKTTWYYTPPFMKGEEGELKVNATKDIGLFKFFDYLGYGLATNKHYNVVTNDNKVTLAFNPKSSKNTGVKEATLYFKKVKKNMKTKRFENLISIELLKNEGKTVTIKLFNVIKNVKFGLNHFVFEKSTRKKIK